jgi:hypothetical protein
MRSDKDRDRERLEQEVATAAYTSLLGDLQKTSTFLRTFKDWSGVIAFMRRGTSRDPAKDAVLLPILEAHAADRDPRWRTILLVVFWPGLESIWRRRRHWDSDPEARWANVTWVFLRAVCRLDPSRRSTRLVKRIINDVFHRLYDEYHQAWDYSVRQIATDPDLLAEMHRAGDGWNAAAELRDEQAARIKHLQTHRDAGRLSEADFLLLVGIHVYGRSLGECAHEAGLNYETAKKRHQRAMKAIGGFPPYEP